MACVELPSANAESEMEEGEIVDELDDLSDISSEEEFLLRQRLQVLENYNNVLERTKAKHISVGSDGIIKVESKVKTAKHAKIHNKHKKSEHRKQIDKENGKNKDNKKKITSRRKKVKSDTSEDSDEEYRNKRRKLADAVSLNKPKDTSTLKDRLTKMLCSAKITEQSCHNSNNISIKRRRNESDKDVCQDTLNNEIPSILDDDMSKPTEFIGRCIDNTDANVVNQEDFLNIDIKKSKEIISIEVSSDEDIELLRQNALQTKSSNVKIDNKNPLVVDAKPAVLSEDEDSDTAELRMICLKSALLKKAIEMKQKQKLQKRLSQCNPLNNDFDLSSDLNNYENYTDIESVDMDIVSEGEDKTKDNVIDNFTILNSDDNNSIAKVDENGNKEEEVEEDEDLLRAKLLTSLSKNLPKLIDNNINTVLPSDQPIKNQQTKEVTPVTTKEEKKFIIHLGESDSEGEHEATKNLTKMHLKLSEQEEFQRKLDIFLKSSRMQVEKSILSDDKPHTQNPKEKKVPKVMSNLPKPEQIEYKNLVRRMAELEKIKLARQSLLHVGNKISNTQDTLKLKNVSKESNKFNSIELDERIAMSRKIIADESAKMLKLKDEATKLTQKFKIVQTELRNIKTAIRINRKQQITVQNGLSNIRYQHQLLLKSLTHIKHSNIIQTNLPINKVPVNKLQKENDPILKDLKNPNSLKNLKVSVVNDLRSQNSVQHSKLSVEVDITNNKKVVKAPKELSQERIVDLHNNNKDLIDKDNNGVSYIHEKINSDICVANIKTQNDAIKEGEINNDYKSPLEALKNKSWEEDPNAFLCPYEVGGSCRDPDCKNLHPKAPTIQ